jgi:hypothetical protein
VQRARVIRHLYRFYAVFVLTLIPTNAMADKLLPNQALAPNQRITSLNGRYYFVYQTDGNLVLYKIYPNGTQKALWASGTNGKPGTTCIMQPDGNLVIYNAAHKPLWSSNTFHDAGSSLVLQDDGNAVIYNAAHKAIWASNTMQKTVPSGPTATGDTMRPSQVLNPGQSIRSGSGKFTFILQTDGNLVLYKNLSTGGQKALWASNTNGKLTQVAIMQPDGNLVLYDVDGKALWASNTSHDPGARFVLQDDGNGVVYRPNNSAAWSTNTFMQTVNLHVKVLTNPSRFTIAQMVNTMRDIYIDAGVNVVLRSTETLNAASPALAALNDVDTGSCTSGNASAEQRALSNFRANAGATDVVVYVCRSVSYAKGTLNGCASFPAGRPMAVIASYCSVYTLAHEVGHVLGLSHVGDSNRLMTGGGTDNITNAPPDLVAAEIMTMINSGFTV